MVTRRIGKIARYAMAPQNRCLIAAPRAMISRRGTQRGIGIDQAIGNALKHIGVFRIQPEMPQLHLGLGPGQSGRAIEGDRVPMPINQIEHGLARLCNQGPEGEAHRCFRGEPNSRVAN